VGLSRSTYYQTGAGESPENLALMRSTDITYVPLLHGFMYLVAVLD
jgi:hypothetical protein